MRPVTSAETFIALAEALHGGSAIAPLPDSDVERAATVDMLQLDEPIQEPDAAVVLATSGSTGRPKGAVLSRAAVGAAADAAHTRLGGPGDWALALPPYYVAGLMVMARVIAAGTTIHEVGSDLARLPAAVDAMRGRRYLAVVPTQLDRALAQPQLTEAMRALDAVLVGGSALDAYLRSRAEQAQINIVASYGMTETCGGCVYDGLPLDGVSVTVQPGTQRIRISSVTNFSGYRLRPDLTRTTLSDGTLITQDRGEWTSDGRLHVLGRVDDEVVTGGINVDLAQLERACKSWPGLAGAEIAVVAVPDARWGRKIVAVTNGPGSVTALQAYLGGRLPRHAAPRELVHLNALPKTAAGKIDRIRLVADLASGLPTKEGRR
ncbi:MAG: menE [Propionibacteriaceae bacterium]|nr:menE [Propionibacteriaceae bacterium]